MLNRWMQRFANKFISKYMADCSTKELTNNREGLLLAKKGAISCLYDFYYIKNGVVYWVNAYYYNDQKKHEILKNAVQNNNHRIPSPKDYFDISKALNLKPDYATFRQVCVSWMKEKDYVFVEDVKEEDLPENLSVELKDVREELKCSMMGWLKTGSEKNELKIYADLFTINGKVCLVTGMGKSDACKVIAEVEDSYDMVRLKREGNRIMCHSQEMNTYKKVDYCVHMADYNFDSIREIDLYTYLTKMHSSAEMCGTAVNDLYVALNNSCILGMLYVPYTESLAQKSKLLKLYLEDA